MRASRPGLARSRFRAAGLVVIAVLLATTLTGCERARLGARCKGSGWGDDGGAWILRCQNGRWARVLTKADYARIILSSLPKPTTTAPPVTTPATTAPPTTVALPPTTNFFDVDLPIGRSNGEIPPGQYVTVASGGQRCSWETTDEFGDTTGGYTDFTGRMYLRVPDEIGRVFTDGSCMWQPAGGASPLTGDGMVRVGLDAEQGFYSAPGGPNCYWETNSSDDGLLDSVIDSQSGPYPQAFYLQPSVSTFYSEGCGTWTRSATWTDRVWVTSTDDDPMLAGSYFGYYEPSYTVDLTGDLSEVVVTVDGWTIRYRPPTGRQFTSLSGDTYPSVAATPDATHAGFSITGHGKTCAVTGGSMTVNPIINGNTGELFRLGADFDIQCGGQGTIHGETYINMI
ncbi:MAG: hypothetical protein U0Q22_18905 [Acidimicrobiales bacterium]